MVQRVERPSRFEPSNRTVHYRIPSTFSPFSQFSSPIRCPGSKTERNFHIILFIVSLIVPLLILIICYSSVYCLIRSIQNDVNGVGERNSGNRHVARNTLNNIAILLLCYVVCWLPFHIYRLLNSIGFDVSKFQHTHALKKSTQFDQILKIMIHAAKLKM